MLTLDEKVKIARESGLFYIEGEIDWKLADFITQEIHIFLSKGISTGTFQNLTFTIDSSGGLVDPGLSIYDAIVSYPGNTKTIVFPRAGSAAATILQAGDKRIITPNGKVLFHHLATRMKFDVLSDKNKLKDELKRLEELNERIIGTVARLTLSREDLLSLYEEEEWIPADRALEIGAVDEIVRLPFAEKKVT